MSDAEEDVPLTEDGADEEDDRGVFPQKEETALKAQLAKKEERIQFLQKRVDMLEAQEASDTRKWKSKIETEKERARKEKAHREELQKQIEEQSHREHLEIQVGQALDVVDFMNQTVMENDMCCCFKDSVQKSIHDDVNEEHDLRMLIPKGVNASDEDVEDLTQKVHESHAVFPFVNLLTLVTILVAFRMVDTDDNAAMFSFSSGPKKAWLAINGFCILSWTAMRFRWCSCLMMSPADPAVAEELIKSETKEESDHQFSKMRWYSNCQQWLLGLFSSQFILYLYFWVETQNGAGELAAQDTKLKFFGHTVKLGEIFANTAHGVAILVGLLLVHSADTPSRVFLQLGSGLKFCEDEAAGYSCIDLSKLLDYAGGLRVAWRGVSNIIDLVDCTDFFLLLFEDDLIEEAEKIRLFTFMNDWELIRFVWILSFMVTVYGNLLTDVFAFLMRKMGLKHRMRFSELPDGMGFYKTYINELHFMRGQHEGGGVSPHDNNDDANEIKADAWDNACEFYDFNLPRRKNQDSFWMAFRSLFFVELPFLILRIYCSAGYGIMASSLLIKNILSALYDGYIFSFGTWRLFCVKTRMNLKKRKDCWCIEDDTDAEEEDGEEAPRVTKRGTQKLQRSDTRSAGRSTWLTSEQMARHIKYGDTGEVEQYEQHGVFSRSMYKMENNAKNNIKDIEEDNFCMLLESTGMVA
jgi:hypothetical protein